MTESKKKKSFKPRKSRLDAYAEIVGSLPDKDVAEQAGVTAENVRTYRMRRNIPARWRGEGDPAPKKDAPKPKAPPKKAKKARKRRPSKLDPVRGLLGEVPDREVAERVGVSAENVRAYRKRHGIEAKWRGEGAPAERDAPEPTPAPAPAPVAVSPRAPRPAPASPTPRAGRFAYQVSIEVEGEVREYVAFGTDMAEVARTATDRLAALHPGCALRSISLVGVAL